MRPFPFPSGRPLLRLMMMVSNFPFPVAVYTERKSLCRRPLLLQSFAVSANVPTWRLAPYFSSTDLPWYFQNCLVASLPATRFRILAPPGCSSRKSAEGEGRVVRGGCGGKERGGEGGYR